MWDYIGALSALVIEVKADLEVIVVEVEIDIRLFVKDVEDLNMLNVEENGYNT